MSADTQEVQLRSYLIWESEGQPEGRDLEHWFRAEAELANEQVVAESASSASTDIGPAKRGGTGTAKKRAAKKA